MKKLELTFLGQPDFKLGGKSINNLVLQKGLALVAYLAVTKQAHSRESLAGLLWGEMTEENARRNLRVALAKLRKHFDDYLIIQRRSVAFNVDSDYWLDAEVFEGHLTKPNPTAAEMQTAVDLYHGPFLADLPLRDAPLFDDWVRPYQERLRQMAMDTLYRLAVINTEERQYMQGIDNLGKLLILEPWMEEAHRQLMLLYALSGQRTSALSQFELCQNVLEDELGVEPSDTTIELYEKILNEDIEVNDTQIIPAVQAPSHLIPFQAPAEKKNFINREELLADLGGILVAPEQPMVHAVVGMGGVGKSALITQIAHLLRHHFNDGLLWANAAMSEPMSILEGWSQLYGYDFSRITDLESMAAAYRGVLADKQVLIVLDDVTSLSRIKPLLPTGSYCRVLITTRDHDLARGLDAQVWLMNELSLKNGRLLLTSILGEKRVQDEPNAALEICALLENLPLAIEIIAQRLKSRPRRRLADVALRLQDEKQRLSELQISDRAVRASFAISYQSLDAQLQRMFALMGLFNGRSFTADALAYIAKLDRYDAEDRIFALTALSLAQEERLNRYKQHALLADFALEKLGDASGEEYGRFAQYYLQFAQQNQHDYDALRPEWDNMMVAMEAAYNHQLWQTVIDYADALNNAWFTRGRYTQARLGYQWVDEATMKLANENKRGENLLRWGQACVEQSDFSEAVVLLNKCLVIFQERNDLALIAQTQSLLARIAMDQSDYVEAARLTEAALIIRDQLNDPVGKAELIGFNARILYRQQIYHESYTLAQTALELYEKDDEQIGILQTLGLLINIHIELRAQETNLESALQHGQRALDLANLLQDTGEKAIALFSLSRVHLFLDEMMLAQEEAKQSLHLLRQIGDRRSEAITVIHLSEIYFYQEDYEKALEVAYAIVPLLQALGIKDREAVNWWNIGHFHRLQEQLDQAKIAWSNCYQIAQKIQNAALMQKLEQWL